MNIKEKDKLQKKKEFAEKLKRAAKTVGKVAAYTALPAAMAYGAYKYGRRHSDQERYDAGVADTTDKLNAKHKDEIDNLNSQFNDYKDQMSKEKGNLHLSNIRLREDNSALKRSNKVLKRNNEKLKQDIRNNEYFDGYKDQEGLKLSKQLKHLVSNNYNPKTDEKVFAHFDLIDRGLKKGRKGAYKIAKQYLSGKKDISSVGDWLEGHPSSDEELRKRLIEQGLILNSAEDYIDELLDTFYEAYYYDLLTDNEYEAFVESVYEADDIDEIEDIETIFESYVE